tara:strand:+ start:3378 stop:3530 length:153 start_codon:yes stop_codon:yes gene_type:complete
VKELVKCVECKNTGILVFQMADGEYQLLPCQCVELASWFNIHAINNMEEE